MADVPPPQLPHQPRRRGVLFALLATALAVPLLLLDIRSDDGEGDTSPVTTRAASTVVVPLDRPETGPPKGISVVTTATTSSTTPLTTTTTTDVALTGQD